MTSPKNICSRAQVVALWVSAVALFFASVVVYPLAFIIFGRNPVWGWMKSAASAAEREWECYVQRVALKQIQG